ncbi:RNA-binding protein [candidate division KSB1 bacterium]|nr:RNA-binding protein [candidate division KSB1 bacterium]
MNIYIGNIPTDLDENEITEMFEEYGIVKSTKIIKDRYTRKSRGFGFVVMENNDAAKKAIEDWDQGSIDDQIIKVREAKLHHGNKGRN